MKCKNCTCSFMYAKTCMRSTVCDNRIPVTQADMIRAMSDDELCDFMYWVHKQLYLHDEYIAQFEVKEWLKEEVK